MWCDLVGHERQVEQFRAALACGRLASSYLFVGPEGIGKRTFALELARVLLCLDPVEERFAPCGECESCRLAVAGTHPDLDWVEKPDDKSLLPIELLIGDREHRMQEGLCHRLALKPFLSQRKVAIIDDADRLSLDGANSLLKTLEEPPPGSVLILIGSSAARQLPTIRSRCQMVRFERLRPDQVEHILLGRDSPIERDLAYELGLAAEGSVGRALGLADSEVWTFRGLFLRELAGGLEAWLAVARQVGEFLEGAGRELGARRQRLRLVVDWAIRFYGELIRALLGVARPATDSMLRESIGKAISLGETDLDAAIERLEHCLTARVHIDRNAHAATLVESWLDGLRHLTLPAGRT
jgi:DNA polymerase-3 subunit delta'